MNIIKKIIIKYKRNKQIRDVIGYTSETTEPKLIVKKGKVLHMKSKFISDRNQPIEYAIKIAKKNLLENIENYVNIEKNDDIYSSKYEIVASLHIVIKEN